MPSPAADKSDAARRQWMAVLARASAAELAAALAGVSPPPYARLRGPEPGLVMLRGRIGGGGGAFNVGEMTVTRCAVRLVDGTVGHAYVAGRDERQAELAAVFDALLQQRGEPLRQAVIVPLAAAQQARRAEVAAKAAATRVQFFAMETWRGGPGS